MTEAIWQVGGWTMLHFLWMGTIVALAGGVLRFACRRAAPGMRYAMSLLTLLALAALPAAIAAWLSLDSPAILAGRMDATSHPANANTPSQDGSAIYSIAAPRVVDLALPEPAAPLTTEMAGNPSPNRSATATALRSVATGDRARLLPSLQGRGTTVATVVAMLPWVWLIGAPMTFTLLAAGLLGAEQLRRTSQLLTNGAAAAACERLRRVMHITRRVSIAVCDGIAQPVLVGIVRPLILLPASALSGWTPEELEMVLMHELAHVRRWDNLVNLLQRIVESLLFFHPAVWLASRQVRRDREECCDAAVLSRIERPHDYAALLVSIAAKMQAQRPAAFVAASAMADHPLAGRIRRILKLEDEPMWVSRRTLGLALALPLVLAALTLYAADPAKPQAADGGENPPPSKGWEQPSTVAGGDRAQGGSGRGAIRGGIEDANPIENAEPANDSPSTIIGSDEEKANTEREKARQRNWLDPNVEIPRVKAEIGRLQSLVEKANEDLVDVEVFKQLALQHANSPAALEKAIAASLDVNPTIMDLQQKLLALQEALQGHTAESKNLDDAQREQLVHETRQIAAQLVQHRAEAEKAAREQIAKMPNDALRAAILEHRIRYESATANLKKYQEELSEASQRLAELSSSKEEASSSTERQDDRIRLRNEQIKSLAKPGQITAAVIEHPGPPGEIDRRLKELNSLGHNVTIRATKDFTVLFIDPPRAKDAGTPWPDAQGEHRLQPGDVVMIEVIGAFPDRPLQGQLAVEPAGTIALGAMYGRAKVAGMTILEAETAVRKHLETLLSDPQVQLSTVQSGLPVANPPGVWPPRAGSRESYYGSRKPGSPETTHLYDGKTFDEWRDLWKSELKTERRVEAINALAAFARAGYGKQASEAILDVAGEYDFQITNKSPEGQLHNAVLNALPKLPMADWLPSLVLRIEKGEGARRVHYTTLANALLYRAQPVGTESSKLIALLATNEDLGLRDAAIVAMLRGDPKLEGPEAVEIVRGALTGDSPTTDLLGHLQFRQLDKLPEQMELLFHTSPEVQRRARLFLEGHARSWVGNPTAKGESDILTVIERLPPILNDPERANDHVAAIRAITAGSQLYSTPSLVERKEQVVERLLKILREGDEQLLAPALVALERLTASSAEVVIQAAGLPEDRVKQLQALAEEIRVEEALLNRGGF